MSDKFGKLCVAVAALMALYGRGPTGYTPSADHHGAQHPGECVQVLTHQ